MSQAREAYKRGYDAIVWKPIVHERKTYIPPKRADFPTPMVVSDSIEPVQSMADGRWHDSKSSLYHSYTPEGNPQGIEYTVVGNDQDPTKTKTGNVKSKSERAQSRKDSIDRAEAKISRGEGVKLPD